ncbi:MAG TPA: hypothetical protein VGK67_33250 [Myxococcales bacterium]|jgi:hypothetical protein
MELARKAGLVAGFLLGPLAAAGARARMSRLFHPTGVVYRASVRPLAAFDSDPALSQDLAGPALVRLSAAWWKQREWPDVLGVAIRFRRSWQVDAEREPDDFDLLLATVRKPWTTLLAPLTTRQHDFLANDYYGVSPFRSAGQGVVDLRLVSESRARGPRADRWAKLDWAVERGLGAFRLEVRAGRSAWRPIARVTLVERVKVDQARLRFSPWLAGRGLSPAGFVQAMRPAAYLLAQAARGVTSSPRPSPPSP